MAYVCTIMCMAFVIIWLPNTNIYEHQLPIPDINTNMYQHQHQTRIPIQNTCQKYKYQTPISDKYQYQYQHQKQTSILSTNDIKHKH